MPPARDALSRNESLQSVLNATATDSCQEIAERREDEQGPAAEQDTLQEGGLPCTFENSVESLARSLVLLAC